MPYLRVYEASPIQQFVGERRPEPRAVGSAQVLKTLGYLESVSKPASNCCIAFFLSARLISITIPLPLFIDFSKHQAIGPFLVLWKSFASITVDGQK